MTSQETGSASIELPLFRRGKVRDTFDLGDALLMVASDRISAFDVVLPTPIPGKGAVLTELSSFWFRQTDGLVPNHFLSSDAEDFPAAVGPYRSAIAGRAMLVRKAERIDVECVVRGYLAGSAWAEYRAGGTIAGEPMPAGMRHGERLPAPLFTPAVKHDDRHDVAIAPDELARIVGGDLAARLEEASRDLYGVATAFAEGRRIVVADTKFEFGTVDGELMLIDELLTPDSSRFWDMEAYRPGGDQPSFDKQFVRDWLERSGWDRRPPAPRLPEEVVAGTQARYGEALDRLTGSAATAESRRLRRAEEGATDDA